MFRRTFTRKPVNILSQFLIVILLYSCGTKRNILLTSPYDKNADTVKTVYVVNDKGASEYSYKIKPNDQISIKNQQNIEFGSSGSTAQIGNSIFYVDDDGSVNLPAIGKIQIAGLTRREAALKLQQIYGEALLKDPIIELTVINLKVTLLGEFSTTGNFLLEKDNTSLIEILGDAKGLTEQADAGKIKIIRGDRSDPEIIYVNLKDINTLSSPKLILQNNDIIYAEPDKRYDIRSSTTTIRTILSVVSSALVIYNIFTR